MTRRSSIQLGRSGTSRFLPGAAVETVSSTSFNKGKERTGDGIGRFAEDGSLAPILVNISVLNLLSVCIGAEFGSSTQSPIGGIFVNPRAWYRFSVAKD
jgi:hypothetical protein